MQRLRKRDIDSLDQRARLPRYDEVADNDVDGGTLEGIDQVRRIYLHEYQIRCRGPTAAWSRIDRCRSTLSKHRNVHLLSSRGQLALASPLIRTNRLDEKTSEHCRETKWRREEKRERGVGCGLAAKELLRLRSFSITIVIYSYGSFGVAHAHEDAHSGCLFVERRRWMGKRERKRGRRNKKAPRRLPQGNPHDRKEGTHWVLAFERIRVCICSFEYDTLRGSRTRCVTESVRILFRHWTTDRFTEFCIRKIFIWKIFSLDWLVADSMKLRILMNNE